MNILHIFGQGCWHEDASIVGDRYALAGLEQAIHRALDYGFGKKFMFCNDGEGYAIRIFMLEAGGMQKMAVPYYEDMARESLDSGALRPGDLLKLLGGEAK